MAVYEPISNYISHKASRSVRVGTRMSDLFRPFFWLLSIFSWSSSVGPVCNNSSELLYLSFYQSAVAAPQFGPEEEMWRTEQPC